MNKRYQLLLRLVGNLYDLQGPCKVRHDYKNQLLERLGSRQHAELADLLIRQITMLNGVYRMKEKGFYRSEKEDLVVTLKLMEGELKSETLLNWDLQMIYLRLLRVYGPGRVFKRSEMQKLLRCSKTNSLLWINRLEKCGRVERIGGSRYQGYYYELVKKE